MADIDLKVLITVDPSSRASLKNAVGDVQLLANNLKQVGATNNSLNTTAQQIATLGTGVGVASDQSLELNTHIDSLNENLQKLITLATSASKSLDGVKKPEESNTKGEDLSPLARDFESYKNAVDKASEAHEHFGEEVDKTNQNLSYTERLMNQVVNGTKFLAGGFLALESVQFFKELADDAAQTEKFDVALEHLGENAGIAKQSLSEIVEGIEKTGQSTGEATRGLAKFVAANLDTTKAVQLATVADNLSITSGQTRAATFELITRAIESGRTQELAHLGIVVNADLAQAKYAATLGTVASALTLRQRQEATANAVIEEGVRIQGTSSSAAFTASERISTLGTNIENLKDSIGKNLLPAYEAIVGVAGEFVADLNKTTDAAGKNGKFAKELGADIHQLAEDFKYVLEFLLQHHDAILTIVEAYVLAKGVINPLVGVIGNLTTNWANYVAVTKAGGKVLADTYVEFKGLITAERELAAADGELAAASTVATTATSGLLSKIALINPWVALAAAVLAVGNAIYQTKQDADEAKGSAFTFTDLFHTGLLAVKQDLDDIWGLLKNIGGANPFKDFKFDSFSTLAGEATGASAGNANIKQKQTLDEAEAVYVKDKEAADDLVSKHSSLVTSGASKELVDAAAQAALDANRKVASDKLAWNEKIQASDLTTSEKDVKNSDIAEKLKARQATDNANDVFEANQKLFGGDLFKDGQHLTREAQESLQSYIKVSQAANTTQLQLQDGFRKVAESARTTDDLKKVTEQLNELKKAGASSGVINNASQFVDEAKLRVASEYRAQTSLLTQLAKARADSVLETDIEGLKAQADVVKLDNQDKSKNDKIAYDLGVIGLEQYYRERADVILSNYKSEELAQNAQLFKLRRDEQLAQTPEEKLTIKQSIQTAQAQQDYSARKKQSDLSDLENEKAAETNTLQLQLIGIKNQVISAYDGEGGKVADITQKYAQLAIKLHGLGGETLEAAKASELFTAGLEDQNKKLQAEIALQEAVINLSKAKNTADLASGVITPAQGQANSSAIANAQQQVIQQQIVAARQKLKELEDQAVTASLSGYGTAGIQLQAKEVITEIDQLQAKFIDLQNTVNAAALSIKKDLTDDISEGLANAVFAGKGGVKALEDIFTNFGKQLTSRITKNLASKVTDSLSHIGAKDTGQIDPVTNKPIKDQGIFSRLASLTGLGAKPGKTPTGSSLSDAFYAKAYILNWPGESSAQGGSDKSTQGLLKTVLGTFKPHTVTGPAGETNAGEGDGGRGGLTGVLQKALGNSPVGKYVQPFFGPQSQGGGDGGSSPGGFPTSSGGIVNDAGNLIQLLTRTASSPSSVLNGAADTLGGGGDGGFDFGSDPLSGDLDSGSLSDILSGFVHGGPIFGAGTGTSDSIPIMASHGEFITNAKSTSKYMPLLHAINNDSVQSIAMPRAPGHYAGGGVVTTPGSAPQRGHMLVTLHPDSLKMSMEEFMQSEISRQYANR